MSKNEKLKHIDSSKTNELESFKLRLNKTIGSNSARSFAIKAGISPTALRKYIDGDSTPNLERLIAIADAGNVSIQWLATGEDSHIKKLAVKEASSNYSNELTPDNDQKFLSQLLELHKKRLQSKGFNESKLIALCAQGDAMEPSIGDSDALIVHTKDTKPIDGNIYAFKIEGQLVVKRIQINLNGSCLLISDNNRYPMMEIKKEEIENFEVIGRVVHIAKDL